MFHIGMWRERLRNVLAAIAADKPYAPPSNANDINDAELPHGIGTPLADASARADHLLSEILDLYERLGERPINWFSAEGTTEAVLRNSYSHPRSHLCEYYAENGDQAEGRRLLDEGLHDLREASASDFPLATLEALRNDPRFQDSVTN